MVKAALVMEAGKFSSFATFLQAFFLITCIEKESEFIYGG